MKMLILDTETQGFEFPRHRITEIGAIIFDTDTMDELARYSAIVWDESYEPQSKEIVEITGITDDILRENGIPFEIALNELDGIIAKLGGITHIIAHNAQFDKRAFNSELNRMDNLPAHVNARWMDLPWVCTINDVKHPEKFRSKKLSHLALDYGVAVNPSELHRADADCELLLKMARAAKLDFKSIAERSKIADVVIRALVPSPFGANNDGGVGKEKAKACGFGWQKAPGTDGPVLKNSWLKKVKEDEIEEEQKRLGYEIRVVS